LASPLTLPNFVTLQQVCDISAVKIFALAKVGQSTPKSLTTCYTPMPLIVPNFIALDQAMYEKCITIFLHPSVFWHPRGAPGPK